jgi:hypothetical protein
MGVHPWAGTGYGAGHGKSHQTGPHEALRLQHSIVLVNTTVWPRGRLQGSVTGVHCTPSGAFRIRWGYIPGSPEIFKFLLKNVKSLLDIVKVLASREDDLS